MKKIEAIVRPEAVEEVKSALFAANVEGMTISQVQGAGNQHGWTEYYRGTEVLVRMRAKVKIEIVLPDERVDTVADIILAAAVPARKGRWAMARSSSTPWKRPFASTPASVGSRRFSRARSSRTR